MIALLAWARQDAVRDEYLRESFHLGGKRGKRRVAKSHFLQPFASSSNTSGRGATLDGLGESENVPVPERDGTARAK